MVSIVPVSGLDPAHATRFAAWNEVFTAVDREAFGPDEQGWALDELRGMESSRFSRRIWLAAVDGDPASAVVGALALTLPTEDNHHLAFGWLTVLPAARRRGIGSALLAAAHEVTLSQGRTVLTVESQWASGGDDLTGAFLASRGFAPAQTTIRSELPLPAEEARLLAVAGVEDAQGGEGAEYVLETTVDGMPDAWLADRANLQQRMSTDTPLGDLELQEEAWDAARMRDEVDRALAAGRRYVETVARHKGSGRLVGFTTITVSAGAPDLAYQWDTLVLREHRGHGLGLRLKAANTLALQRHAPAVRRARTWNADDNAHMLAVNTALGYLPVGHSREWQKHLGD